eukprot:tig00020780_g13778.t1
MPHAHAVLLLGFLAGAACVCGASVSTQELAAVRAEREPDGIALFLEAESAGFGNLMAQPFFMREDAAFGEHWCEGLARRRRAVKPEMADLLASTYLRVERAGQYQVGLLVNDFATDKYGMLEADVRPGDIVVDIGANMGLFSILAAELWPQARVYAYEPAPRAFAFLQHNIRANNLTGRVRIFNAAVTGDGRPVRIRYDAESHLFTNVYGRSFRQDLPGGHDEDPAPEHHVAEAEEPVAEEQGGGLVPSVTLDEIWDQIRADLGTAPLSVGLLKVDCEGCEHELFADRSALVGTKVAVWSARGEVHAMGEVEAGRLPRRRTLHAEQRALAPCIARAARGLNSSSNAFRCDRPKARREAGRRRLLAEPDTTPQETYAYAGVGGKPVRRWAERRPELEGPTGPGGQPLPPKGWRHHGSGAGGLGGR